MIIVLFLFHKILSECIFSKKQKFVTKAISIILIIKFIK